MLAAAARRVASGSCPSCSLNRCRVARCPSPLGSPLLGRDCIICSASSSCTSSGTRPPPPADAAAASPAAASTWSSRDASFAAAGAAARIRWPATAGGARHAILFSAGAAPTSRSAVVYSNPVVMACTRRPVDGALPWPSLLHRLMCAWLLPSLCGTHAAAKAAGYVKLATTLLGGSDARVAEA